MISTGTSANVIHDAAGSHQRVDPRVGTPRRAALAVLATYLVGAGIVALTGRHALIVLAHLGLLLVVAVGWKSERRSATLAGDMLPLVAFPVLYSELPVLIESIGSAYHDAAVQSWETAVFGAQVSATLAEAVPIRAVSEILHAGYLAYYLIIFIPPLLLYWRNERRPFAVTILALAITYAICWSIFIAYPVQGPRYLFIPSAVPAGPMRGLTQAILSAGSSRGAAFPSSHMAVSVTQAMMALYWQRGVGKIVSIGALLVGLGAVYGGFHYGVDVLAGTGLALLVSAVVLGLFPRGTIASAIE